MNPFKYILLFLILARLITHGQPVLNERYIINDATSSVFSSVIATDSCYYVSGGHTNGGGFSQLESHFIRFHFDGSINFSSNIDNDTMGIGFFPSSQMIKTLDGNFAQMALAKETDAYTAYLFMKITPLGDTLFTKYYPEFYNEELLIGKDPGQMIQLRDSTFFGVLSTQREDDLRAPAVFYRLNKKGELLFFKTFYGLGVSHYHILKPYGLVQIEPNRFVISSSLINVFGDAEDKRHHTKLILVDTLGNLIEEHTYWEDTLALDCFGFTKSADGSLIYAGQIGRHNPVTNGFRYRGQIVKLNLDYTVDWKMTLGDWTGSPYVGLRKIMKINDEEYVMVGFMRTHSESDNNQYGWLIKFNIDGEKIWERKYLKIPHEHLAPNYPEHQLFDVDTTVDGGFVMVGAGINYENEEELSGQKAWLVKTNRYGCIVPGCQFGDIPMDAEPKDTAIVPNPKPEEPKTWLYPNPASKSLFYYHHQDIFNFGTAYIYNSAGELVQKWDIGVNDITYEIDVSEFASGQYVLQVLDGDGVLVEVERFVKI
jgi:hypothetical protein